MATLIMREVPDRLGGGSVTESTCDCCFRAAERSGSVLLVEAKYDKYDVSLGETLSWLKNIANPDRRLPPP